MRAKVSYEIDGWFKHDIWNGTSYELKMRANELLRKGAIAVTLHDVRDGSLLYYRKRNGISHG